MKTARYDQRRSLVRLCVATKRVALVCVAAFISGGIAPARADDQPNRIIVEYVPPQDPAHQSMYDWLREHHVLERSKELFSPFRLPTDLVLRLQGCDGKVNAWFRRWSVTI